MKQYRTIFHLDEEQPEKVVFVLNNIINLLDDLGNQNVDVELLVNGPAVKAFKAEDNPILDKISKILQQSVVIALCNNALRSHGLDPASMLADAIVVPSGVGELVRKQAEGWAYIRP
jgi:intracellular sulfur oxidation DsrE/DsrF family protein